MDETNESWGDRLLVPGKPLTPRHKKLAELAAQGKSNQDIAKELDYSESRVCILLSNSMIKTEIQRIKDMLFEDTKKRLKEMARPALDEIEKCLNDETGRYKEQLKVETSKWVLEKVDGKATQPVDFGETTLAAMMDRLDAIKAAGQNPTFQRDVTANAVDVMEIEAKPTEIAPKTDEDLLSDWVTQYVTTKKS